METRATRGGRGSDKAMLAQVHSELHEVAKRKQNVIVHGFAPVPGRDDANTFADFCEVNLPVRPAAVRSSCKRLGKDTGGKVKPLLVGLSKRTISK